MSKRRQSTRDRLRARQYAKRAYSRQGGRCFWCHEAMIYVASKPWPAETDPRLMTADHVIPWRWGGRSTPGNIVAACYECNQRRDQGLRGMELTTVAAEVMHSPFEVLAALKPALEAEEAAAARRRERKILARYGQLL